MPATKPPKHWLNSPGESRHALHSSGPWRVLVIDGHPSVRHELVQLLTCEPDFIVCAEAGNARKAMVAIAETKPDVVTTGIILPEIDGVEFARELVGCWPELPVLVLSSYDEMQYAERALHAGAKGYLMKQEATGKLAGALRQVLNGEIYLSDNIADKLMREEKLHRAISRLSDREREVFRWVGGGHKTQEIADHLGLKRKTIDGYRTSIKAKLKLKTAQEFASLAAQWLELIPA